MRIDAGSFARRVSLGLFLLVFTSCGGGGGGSSGGGGSPSTAVSDSTEASSGALGIFLSGGIATVAAPSGTGVISNSNGGAPVTSSGTAYLIDLTLTPSYTPISTCSFVPSIGGINLDTTHSVGVAFDITNYTLGFFTFSGNPSTVNSCSAYSGLGTTDLIVTSAGSTRVGGVILDPTIQTAIVETGSGFQFVDYSTPSAPVVSLNYSTIPSYEANPSTGIDIVENFAYDPYLVIKGVSHKMILSGSGAVSYSQGLSDGDLLEIADIQTGTVYRPDTTTSNFFQTSQTPLGCSADAISIDTVYQVAIIGCEYDGLSKPTPTSTFSSVTVLVNLNELTLNSNGTFSLPQSAISPVVLTYSAPPQNNVFVDSVNHIVMWGSGGDWSSSNSNHFSVAKLSDPFTSFGNGLVGGSAVLARMPPYSTGNTVTCNLTGCTNSFPSSWVGYGYPHGSAMYVDSNNNSVALWMNQAGSFLAMVKANEILSSNGSTLSGSVTYVGIP